MLLTTDVKIFTGSATRYLAEDIADHYGQALGKMEVLKFSDGEFQPEIKESVRGSFVLLYKAPTHRAITCWNC
jgi:ribose-phosphate pyrophosphokinase